MHQNSHENKHSGGDGHEEHGHHSSAMFRDKFWLSLLLTIPVLYFSSSIQEWVGYTALSFAGSQFIPLIIGTFIFFYGGMVFIRGAASELKTKQPGMMTLISLAIVTSYTYSIATIFFIEGTEFFWELSTLITVMLLGHWLEMRSISKAQGALGEIAKLLPDKANKISGDKTVEVKVSELQTGDKILVRPGERIAADGKVVDGKSSVNESSFSGETKSVNKTRGSEVVAGTVNQDGSLTIEVTAVGESTALAGIMRLVSEAQASKSRTQILADKAAFWLTLVSLGSGLATFLYWLIFRDFSFALERTVTVLVITCPHALGLAIPLVVSISTTVSAKNGLLVRKRLALEAARKLDTVLFDKTGTLTSGRHGVTNIRPVEDGYTDDKLLEIAAALEYNSEHMLGKGIVKEAAKRNINYTAASDFKALPGEGVKGKYKGAEYTIAGESYVRHNDLQNKEKALNAPPTDDAQPASCVFVIRRDTILGTIELADIVRDESFETIQALTHMNIKSAMITGDSKKVASFIAGDLEIETYFAEVKPDEKADKVKSLQKLGQKVAMVGDGINDAPALTQANIGIAIGAGTDVAINSADVILIKNDPRDVVKFIRLSRYTYNKMIQNLIWATGYNLLALPLAAGVLVNQGILLSPAVGAIFMSLSTVIVALNAQLLRSKKL